MSDITVNDVLKEGLVTFMFIIDAMSRMPLFEQIKIQLERFIQNGTIVEGEQIPSIRNLSLELSINPNTILKAYTELDNMGLIYSVPGRGYFVCQNAREVLAKTAIKRLDELEGVFFELAQSGITQEQIKQRVDKVYNTYERGAKNND